MDMTPDLPMDSVQPSTLKVLFDPFGSLFGCFLGLVSSLPLVNYMKEKEREKRAVNLVR